MTLIIDIINTLFLTLLKPMLVIAVLMYAVSHSEFRSAASKHWVLSMALVSPVLLLVLFSLLPSVSIGVLPPSLVPYTKATIFASSESLFSATNVVTVAGLCVYVSGLCLIVWRTAMSFISTLGLTRSSSPVSDNHILALGDELSRLFGVQRVVDIRISRDISSPIMWGYTRPTILLPRQYLEWSDDRLKRVLAHEFAHIARNDWITKLLSHLVCVVFWVNPLMWKAAKQSAWFAELACDDLVVSKLHCRAEYADDLFELSTDASHELVALAFIKKSELYLRIHNVLDGAKNRSAPSLLTKLGLFALLGFLLLPISVLHASQSAYENVANVPTPRHRVILHDGAREAYQNQGKERFSGNDGVPPLQEEAPFDLEALKQRYRVNTQVIRSEPLPLRVVQYASLEASAHASMAKPRVTLNSAELTRVEVEPHKNIVMVTPNYPKKALKKNLEAKVVVALDVDLQGRVLNPRIISNEHSKVFNRSVLKAVKQFVYQPMQVNGHPIITRNVQETFVFTIKDAADTRNFH